MADESTLLAEYVATGSQDAFAQLTRRYVDMVYSAARRQVGDAHLAEDVTQAVFLVLAKRARSIRTDGPLSGWLLKVTSYCAANARRTRARREAHEQRAAEMMSQNQSEDHWTTLAPLLDEGLGRLPQADRNALLLRFFEHKSLQQVGEALGISQDAAQKRVTRAVERLRVLIIGRDATAMSAAALSELLLTRAVATAPAGLATSVASATAGANSAMLAKGAMIIMATQKVKMIAATAAVLLLGLGGGAVVIHSMAAKPIENTNAVIPQASPSIVSFADGTSVEMLGISEAPPNDKESDALVGLMRRLSGSSTKSEAWWGTDGAPIEPLSLKGFGEVSLGQRRGYRLIRIVLAKRGPGVANDSGLTIRVNGVTGSSATSTFLANNEERINSVFELPDTMERTQIRFGLAIGPWREDASMEVAGAEANPPKPDALFQKFSEEGGQCAAELNWKRMRSGDRASQVLVVLKNGKQVLNRSWNSYPDGRAVLTFPCRKDDVAKIVWRTRAYEWQTSGDVVLTPAPRPVATTQATAIAEK